MKKVLFLVFAIVIACDVVYAEETYWFSDGVLANQVSCTVGGDITTPGAPYKYGHRFVNWAAAPTYDMTTLDTTINKSDSSGSGNIWRAKFSYGTVVGEAFCSATTNATFNSNGGIISSASGTYCYCRVVGFIPMGETNVFAPTVSLPWAFGDFWYSISDCNSRCSNKCVGNMSQADFRAKLYGIN